MSSLLLLAALSATPLVHPSQGAPLRPVADETEEETRPAGPGDGVLDQAMALREKYLPLWFQDGLHPQVEDKKYLIFFINFLAPLAFSAAGFLFLDFWTPLLILEEPPRFDLEELVITYGVYLLASAATVIGYLVLGISCPPGLGFYCWALPYVGVSMLLRWMYHMGMVHAWDRMLKKQDGERGAGRDSLEEAAP